MAKLKLANMQRSLEAFYMLQEIGFELFLIQFMSMCVCAAWLVSGQRYTLSILTLNGYQR